MKYLQTKKRIKASIFRSAILALIAFSLFAGCSVYSLDGDGTSGGSYTASDIAGSYTGSSTLNAMLLEIMKNCTDSVWTEWLTEKYSESIMSLLGEDGFKTKDVTSTTLTLSAGSSFTMNIIYKSTLTAILNNDGDGDGDGELEISGTWSVSGSDVTFTYSSSNVEEEWETASNAIVSIIRTLVNGAEMWTDGSNLYGRFGYGNYWTDSSATLFTR